MSEWGDPDALWWADALANLGVKGGKAAMNWAGAYAKTLGAGAAKARNNERAFKRTLARGLKKAKNKSKARRRAREYDYSKKRPSDILKEEKVVDYRVAPMDDPKVYNTTAIVTSMSDNAFIFPLNVIQPGNGAWNRIGRLCQFNSIEFNGTITLTYEVSAALSNTLGRNLRFVLVHDRQPNGALPRKDTIFGAKDQTGTDTSDMWSPINIDKKSRFEILSDNVMNINPNFRNWASIADGKQTNKLTVVQKYKFFTPIAVLTNYQAENDPANIADISTGAIYVVFLTDAPFSSGGIEDGNLSCTGTFRVRFYD